MSGHRDREYTNVSEQTNTTKTDNYVLGEVYTPGVSNTLPQRPVDQTVKVESTNNGVVLDFSSPFSFDAVNTYKHGKTADGGKNALVIGKREFEQGLQKEFEGSGATLAQAAVLAGSKTESIFEEFNTDGKVGLSRLEFEQARKSLGLDKQEVQLTTTENQNTVQIKAPNGDTYALNTDNLTANQKLTVTATDNNVTVKVADSSNDDSTQKSGDRLWQSVGANDAFRWWDMGLTSQSGFASHDGLSKDEYKQLVQRMAQDSPVKNVADDSAGSSTVTLQDGTNLTWTSDGTTTIVGADGRSMSISADGTRCAIQANGNETVIRPDGSGYFTYNGEMQKFEPIKDLQNNLNDKGHDTQGDTSKASDSALHFNTPFTFGRLNTNHRGRKLDGTKNSEVIGRAEYQSGLQAALEESGLSPEASRLAAIGAVDSIFGEYNRDGKAGLTRVEFKEATKALQIGRDKPAGLPGKLASEGQLTPGYIIDLGQSDITSGAKISRQVQSW